MPKTAATPRALVALLIVVFFVIVLRDAWIGDDAFITLRTVKNFVEGRGIVWNAVERVQTYTHPLWMFFLSIFYFVTREGYYTTLAACLSTSMLAVGLLGFRVAVSPGNAFAALTLLISSRAFVDYSTSGLENPLNHLLAALFVLHVSKSPAPANWRSHLRKAGFIATAAVLNRVDMTVLFAPTVGLLAIDAYRRSNARIVEIVRTLLVAGSPFLAWEVFSFLYYGSWVPNTALAKLNTSIASGEMARQGVQYLWEVVLTDPLTAIGCICAVGFALVHRRLWSIGIAIGIALYLLYIIRIGGDFMSGRFATVPFFIGTCMMARGLNLARLQGLAIAAVVLVVASASPRAPLSLTNPHVGGQIDVRGIADERAYYFAQSGMASLNRILIAPNHGWRHQAERTNRNEVVARGAIGYFGFFAHPSVYVVDSLALSDPLLARLPARHDPNWRIGHFVRVIPNGYLESLRSGHNQFEDVQLGEYYTHLRRVVRSSVFSRKRLHSLWLLSTGQLDHLVDVTRYRFDGEMSRDLATISAKPSLDPSSLINLEPAGMRIDLPERSHAPRISVEVGVGESYDVVFFGGQDELARLEISRAIGLLGPLQRRILDVPKEAIQTGYTAIRVLPRRGVGPYSIGNLSILNTNEPLTDEQREFLELSPLPTTPRKRSDARENKATEADAKAEPAAIAPLAPEPATPPLQPASKPAPAVRNQKF